MALPGNAAGFVLSGGTYDDPAFQGMAGKLTLSAPVTHVATGERVRKTWDFSIDYNGQFSIGPLPWTDDPAFTPTGWTYSIEWQALAWKDVPGNLTFQVPMAAGSTVDFDTLVPALGGGQTIPLGVYSVNGKQGAVTLGAPDVGADAAGAATTAQAAAVAAAATDATAKANAAQAAAIAATSGQVTDAAVATQVTTGTTTTAALRAAYVPKWKASTAYAAGEPVLNPAGQIVTATAAFTSGATYSAANWAIVGTASLPTQTGNAGKFLTTDGTAASWGTPAGGGSVSDATTGAKGIVQLAGDLAGTAAAPQVTSGANHGHTTSQISGLGTAATQPTSAFDAAGAAAAAQAAAQTYAAGAAAGLALVFGA